MLEKNYLTEGQIDFLNWIYHNKYSILKPHLKITLASFRRETGLTLKQGYCIGSAYQIHLNEIRNNYLKEYQQSR